MSRLPASSDQETQQLKPEPVSTILAEHFSLRSNLHGESFRIWISLPLQPPPPQGHAALYLFDGRSYFAGVSEIARIMSVSQEIAPLVVVGIGYDEPSYAAQVRRRTQDLTLSENSPMAEPPNAGDRCRTGGAPLLLQFIHEELKPLIRRRYRVDATREILMGHSLGGLTAAYAALTQPRNYFGYVASSPAIFADKDAIARAMETSSTLAIPTRLYVSVGEHENNQISRMVDDMQGFSAALSSPQLSNVEVVTRVLPHETHATALYSAVPQSLRWMMKDMPVDTDFDLTRFRL